MPSESNTSQKVDYESKDAKKPLPKLPQTNVPSQIPHDNCSKTNAPNKCPQDKRPPKNAFIFGGIWWGLFVQGGIFWGAFFGRQLELQPFRF